ncbi:hypothetical protein F5X97DRAFT_308270 [Nemania serpens]|nr:hypothetical protein F5X97DRAFT_308270 [Nemania serpens]
MSDQSDRDDGLSLTDQDSDESETEQGDGFFDLEADESDDHDGDENGDEDDGDDGDDGDDAGKPYSFPQFSRLPPELRTMIWEAVDPDLKSQGRVLDFQVIGTREPLWASATLAEQTAPARALLSTNKESRYIALAHYPDVINIEFDGVIRFRGSSDIILLRTDQNLGDVLNNFRRWSSNIKYLAFSVNLEAPVLLFWEGLAPDQDSILEGCRNLEAILFCFHGDELRIRELDWSVSKSAKQFYRKTFEEIPGLSRREDCSALYCWPDTTLHATFADCAGESYVEDFLRLLEFGDIPLWPMAQYCSESGLELYHRVKRYAERSDEHGFASSPESSEGESISESESDDYSLDGFVVDNFSERSEESSDDEHDDSFDGNGDEEDAGFHYDPNAYNGFSPLQSPTDDEATSNLPNTTQAIDEARSLEDLGSDASSLEEEPRAARRSSRRKRRIVASDDEDDEEDGGTLAVEGNSRGKKRVRVEISKSEDGGDGDGDGTGSEVEYSIQPRKRARTIVSRNEDTEDEETEEEKTDDGDDDDDEEEPRASKPISLFAKLRQFRSEVRISPENESSTSGEEYDEEKRFESDEEEVSDTEFPESAGEDGEANGW